MKTNLRWGGNNEAQRQADEAYRRMLASKRPPAPNGKYRRKPCNTVTGPLYMRIICDDPPF